MQTSLHRKPGSSARLPGRSQRRRGVLSVNMISLPLADFRHLSHISGEGHSGSFGDLSFLKRGHSLLLQSSRSEQNLFLASFSSAPPPKPPRLNLEEEEEGGGQAQGRPDWAAGPARTHSAPQRRAKCSSMPLLDSEDGEGVEYPGTVPGGGPSLGAGHGSPRQGSLSSGRDGDSTATQEEEGDGGFSFSLDLGPSILDEVLQVMDRLHH
ncbi:uncharacterized protein FYW47_009852 [Aplochiton taeniatus]